MRNSFLSGKLHSSLIRRDQTVAPEQFTIYLLKLRSFHKSVVIWLVNLALVETRLAYLFSTALLTGNGLEMTFFGRGGTLLFLVVAIYGAS